MELVSADAITSELVRLGGQFTSSIVNKLLERMRARRRTDGATLQTPKRSVKSQSTPGAPKSKLRTSNLKNFNLFNSARKLNKSEFSELRNSNLRNLNHQDLIFPLTPDSSLDGAAAEAQGDGDGYWSDDELDEAYEASRRDRGNSAAAEKAESITAFNLRQSKPSIIGHSISSFGNIVAVHDRWF